MSHPAIHVLAGAHGHQGAYDSWGSLALDLHLLAGPEVLLPLLRTHTARDEAFLRSDDSVEAGVLVDPVRRELLLFAREGASATMSTRSAALTLLRHAWPEWQVRWVYEGQTGLRARLGLDPADDHSTTGTSYPLFPLGPGELADVEPMTAVVTIGADRCHVLDLGADHPLAEGPDLPRRLDDAPRHTAYTARAGADCTSTPHAAASAGGCSAPSPGRSGRPPSGPAGPWSSGRTAGASTSGPRAAASPRLRRTTPPRWPTYGTTRWSSGPGPGTCGRRSWRRPPGPWSGTRTCRPSPPGRRPPPAS